MKNHRSAKNKNQPGLLLLLALSLFCAFLMGACSKSSEALSRYHCPMHPTYVSAGPGDCPICGMRLVPIEPARTNAAPSPSQADPLTLGLSPIDVDENGLRLAGVRTKVAENAILQRTIRAVGAVRADETKVRHMHTKVSGWVEKLFVNFTGEPVRKGQPILTIYSQELLATEQEYIRALEAAHETDESSFAAARQGARDMLAATKRRLELFDVPASFIAQLDQTRTPQRTVTLLAPSSGIVMSKDIFEGHQVEPGTVLFTISDLSRVWIEADLYENEANAVHLGDLGTITLSSDQNISLTGRVKYIYPYLNPETRTLKIRFEFPNPNLKLKLDSFVNVEIPVQSKQGVIVPDSAILDTGLRQIVFINSREGHFEPHLVKVGLRADGKAQLLSGVLPGQAVAIKANFLLDSESRLRGALDSIPANNTTARAAAKTP